MMEDQPMSAGTSLRSFASGIPAERQGMQRLQATEAKLRGCGNTEAETESSTCFLSVHSATVSTPHILAETGRKSKQKSCKESAAAVAKWGGKESPDVHACERERQVRPLYCAECICALNNLGGLLELVWNDST